jgi:nicotinamidase-related amidase
LTASPGVAHAPTNDYINNYKPSFQLDPAKTAFLVIDLQNASCSRHHGLGARMKELGQESTVAYRFDRIENTVVPNVRRMLDLSHELGIQVIYVVIGSVMADFSDMPPHMRMARDIGNIEGTEVNAILAPIQPIAGDLVLRKTTISAFTSTNIDLTLRAMGRTQLLFAGVSTNMCVETTARDAADRGYDCVLVDECMGSAKQEYHDATLTTFQRTFGRVLSVAEVESELAAIPTR